MSTLTHSSRSQAHLLDLSSAQMQLVEHEHETREITEQNSRRDSLRRVGSEGSISVASIGFSKLTYPVQQQRVSPCHQKEQGNDFFNRPVLPQEEPLLQLSQSVRSPLPCSMTNSTHSYFYTPETSMKMNPFEDPDIVGNVIAPSSTPIVSTNTFILDSSLTKSTVPLSQPLSQSQSQPQSQHQHQHQPQHHPHQPLQHQQHQHLHLQQQQQQHQQQQQQQQQQQHQPLQHQQQHQHQQQQHQKHQHQQHQQHQHQHQQQQQILPQQPQPQQQSQTKPPPHSSKSILQVSPFHSPVAHPKTIQSVESVGRMKNTLSTSTHGQTNFLNSFDPLSNGNSSKSTRTTTPHVTSTGHNVLPQVSSTLQLSTVDLSEIAKTLASLKPRKNTEQEEAQEAQVNHLITLGALPQESTGTKKSHVQKQKRSSSKASSISIESSLENPGSIKSRSMSFMFRRNCVGGDSVDNSRSSTPVATRARSITPLKIKGRRRGDNDTRAGLKDETRSNTPKIAITPTTSATPKDAVTNLMLSKGKIKVSSLEIPPTLTNLALTPGNNYSAPANIITHPRLEDGVGCINNEKEVRKKNDESDVSDDCSDNSKMEDCFSINNECSVSGIASVISNGGVAPPGEVGVSVLRSSEQDPTEHQLSIPTCTETLLLVRLCYLMYFYRSADQNFDFRALRDLDREDMISFLAHGSVKSTITMEGNRKGEYAQASNSISTSMHRPTTSIGEGNLRMGGEVGLGLSTRCGGVMSSAGLTGVMKNSLVVSNRRDRTLDPLEELCQQQLMNEHKPIISSLINCGDDILLEAFYHEDETDKNNQKFDTSPKVKSTQDRAEVAIFQSDKNRQFLVVYQGSTTSQVKPIRNREQKAALRVKAGNQGGSSFCKEQPFPIFEPFKNAYNSNREVMEKKVFKKLDDLVEQHPFFDVIMTGHSFGGVLATLASMRYSNFRPQIMVSCIVFGCPKIGTLKYRQYVNSLPNLKMMRMEFGSDPWVQCPECPPWVHAGHTIVVNSVLYEREIKLSSKGIKGDGGNALNDKSNRGQQNDKQNIANDAKLGDKENKSEVNITLKKIVPKNACVNVFKFGDNVPNIGTGIGGRRFNFMKKGTSKKPGQDIMTYVNSLEQVETLDITWPTHYFGENVGAGVSGYVA